MHIRYKKTFAGARKEPNAERYKVCYIIQIKFRSDQISQLLPTTRHRCNIDVWGLAQSYGDGHRSLVTPERVSLMKT